MEKSKEKEEKKIVCHFCGTVAEEDNFVEFDGKWLCPECLTVETRLCSRCGERIWRSENSGDSSTILCEDCCDRYYTYCFECDRLILRDEAHYDGDEPLCYRCYEGTFSLILLIIL